MARGGTCPPARRARGAVGLLVCGVFSGALAHDPPTGVDQGPGWICPEEGPWSQCDDGPFFGPTGPASQLGRWDPDIVDVPVQATHAIVIPTGEVMLYRGTYIPTTVYLFDPETRLFDQTDAVGGGDLFCSGHVTLADGRVAIVGGELDEGPPAVGIDDLNIYDPFRRRWEQAANMTFARWYPTATTLADGRVLVVGGRKPADENGPSQHVRIPEVYDPQTNRWTSLTNAEASMHPYSYLFVLPNEKVAYVGPKCDSSNDFSTRTLDLGTKRWKILPTEYQQACKGSAVSVRPGVILKTGGSNPAKDYAEIIDFNVSQPEWRRIDGTDIPRRRHDLVLLPTGQVLCVGGTRAGFHTPECAIYAAEIWDPETEEWEYAASSRKSRMYHSTTILLPDGRVLAAGGERCIGSTNREELNAEFYEPPYLHRGPRPVVRSAPSQVNYGSRFNVTTNQADSIDSVALLRPGAVTHNYDQNQRYVPLTFTRPSADRLRVDAPVGGGWAPPGYYMLFIVDDTGVPSVAHFIQIGDALSSCGDNGEPSAQDGEASTAEDSPVDITLEANDPDGDSLSYTIVTQPAHGSLSGDGPDVTYTPDPDYNGSDSFRFRVNDECSDSEIATVELAISAVNDLPIAIDQLLHTLPDTELPLTLAGTDGDGDPLTYVIVDPPVNGTLSGTLPEQVYAPFEGFLGVDQFSFLVNDGSDDSNTATIAISVAERPDVVLYLNLVDEVSVGGLTIEPCDILAFDGIGFMMHFDGSDVGLTANNVIDGFDIVSESEILLSFLQSLSHADLEGSADDSDIVRFAVEQSGDDTRGVFERYFDGSDVGLSESAEDIDALALLEDGRLLVSTTGPFDVPDVSGADEDLLVFEPTLLGSRTRGSWSLYFDGSDVQLTTSGEDLDSVAVDAAGNLHLSTTKDFAVEGTSGDAGDVFVFLPTQLGRSTEGSFFSTLLFDAAAAGVTGNLGGIDIPAIVPNESPVASADRFATNEDETLNVPPPGVLAGDSDPEDDPLEAYHVSGPDHGELTLNSDGSFTYMPPPDFNGSVSFTYTAFDGDEHSDETTVTVDVAPVNDRPQAQDRTATTSEDTPVRVVVEATDVENDPLTYVAFPPAHGSVSGSGPEFVYTPAANFAGEDSFRWVAVDDTLESEPATVTITVRSVNDAPIAIAQALTTAADTPLEITLTGTDADGDDLTFHITALPANGNLIGDAPSVTYVPERGFSGSDSFEFASHDGLTLSEPARLEITVLSGPSGLVYFSLAAAGTVGGVDVADEDVVRYDGQSYTLLFDGSDVGIGHLRIDAMAVLSTTDLLLSFAVAGRVPGIAQVVDDSDVVRFAGIELGENTRGFFSLHLDGSDVGLTTAAEDIDALAPLPGGRLLVSTLGATRVEGVSAADEDILEFTPTSLGATTAGTWRLLLDGSSVGLEETEEDIDALSASTDRVWLSTIGDLQADEFQAAGGDIVELLPVELREQGLGTFALFQSGLSVAATKVNALDVHGF